MHVGIDGKNRKEIWDFLHKEFFFIVCNEISSVKSLFLEKVVYNLLR